MPSGLDQPIRSLSTARSQLTKAIAVPNRVYDASATIIVGIGLLVLAFTAIALLTNGREGAGAAICAVLLAGLAGVCGVVTNSLVNLNLAGLADSRLPTDAASRALYTVNRGAVPTTFLVLYVFGFAVASIVMAVALWRSRSIPRWVAAAFPITLVLGSLAPPGLGGVLLSVPFALVSLYLARAIWTAPAPTSTA